MRRDRIENFAQYKAIVFVTLFRMLFILIHTCISYTGPSRSNIYMARTLTYTVVGWSAGKWNSEMMIPRHQQSVRSRCISNSPRRPPQQQRLPPPPLPLLPMTDEDAEPRSGRSRSLTASPRRTATRCPLPHPTAKRWRLSRWPGRRRAADRLGRRAKAGMM